jgi:UDP-N-acetylglucosamine 2-epimerase (non-hydrolysing)
VPLVDLIAGARPNFMKIAPIIRALESQDKSLKYRLVHTGQHYDANMSEDFFTQLDIPRPDVNLEGGSGTQASQAAAIMTRYESLLLDKPSDLCLVVGDVTSTMACAIAAQKLGIPVAHVEGGLRSGDWSMPEEINRRVTDSISNYFFTTSLFANDNLRAEGVGEERIFFVGNTMIDTLLANQGRLRAPSFWNEYGFSPKEYLVLTLHRPANVDADAAIRAILEVIGKHTRGMPVVFPVHPRAANVLSKLVGLPDNLIVVDPQPYLEFNYLVMNAKGVITDSGGITEETTVLGVPCMTLRDSTERPETVEIGTNELLGRDPKAIADALDRLLAGKWKSGRIPELWDGQAATRIVKHLEALL